ncbi:MAG: efflux RND transporter permease subunit, partial [Candidatus Sericytochromatia bacterium]
LGREEALLTAGHDRLRPIIMTTIAMIAGMTPIALGIGEGTERLSPLATAVIGGLITSTLLTLVVIPVAYTFVDDLQGVMRRRFGHLIRPRTEKPAPAHAGKVPVAHQPEP